MSHDTIKICPRNFIDETGPCISVTQENSTSKRLHARIQRGVRGLDPQKITKNIGFLSITGPDPLKNHKAAKPEFIVVSSSASQRKAI